MKRVLDIGNCGPDHASLRELLESNFDVVMDRADRLEDSVALLDQHDYALVFVNRKLDCDYSEGAEVIRAIKAGPWADTPTMMITNFPEHQESAVQLGAVPGFGKDAIRRAETIELLRNYLA